MIKTISLLVYLSSITLQHVASFAPRLTEEELDSFDTDKPFAQSYAMQLCDDIVNFFVNMTSFESAYGKIGKSLYSETTSTQVDGGKPIIGYTNIEAEAYLARNLSEFFPTNCTQNVYNDDSLFLDRKIFIRLKGRTGLRGVGAGGLETIAFKKYFFESDGTLKKVQWQTIKGRKVSDFLNAAKEAAKTTLSAVQYIGLIEEQIEGSERNIQFLTKLVYMILVLFCVVIAASVAYLVNMCLLKCDKQRVKYHTVPQIVVD